MKKIIIYIALSLSSSSLMAQFLTQSAQGKSTIPLPLKGIGAALDIGKSEVAIGVNNYANVLSDKSKLLIGGNLSAKSADGLGSLFSSGDIVPQGDFLGFFGYSVSNNKKLISKFDSSGLDQSIQHMNAALDNLLKDYIAILREDIILSAEAITDTAEQRFIKNQLLNKLATVTTAVELKAVVTGFKPTDLTERFAVVLDRAWQPHLKAYVKEANVILDNKNLEKTGVFNDYIDQLVPMRLTSFIQGGISARSFTRYLGLNIASLSKSFQDTLFRGGNIGLGINLQVQNFWLGVTYSYIRGDNFAALKSKEYMLRTTDTTRNQALIAEKKITAYPGNYGKVETNQLNIDLVGDFRMNDTSRLITNLYLRGSLHSRDMSLLKNYTNIGVGIYFVGKKSSFLGGLYIELPDINNNLEKAKPLDTQNIRSPFKKLSFGIVTKFSIASIFNWSNRPVKPD